MVPSHLPYLRISLSLGFTQRTPLNPTSPKSIMMINIVDTQKFRPQRPKTSRLRILINLTMILCIFSLIDFSQAGSTSNLGQGVGFGVQAAPVPIATRNVVALPLPLFKPHGALGFELEVVSKSIGLDERLIASSSSSRGEKGENDSEVRVGRRAVAAAREDVRDGIATMEARNEDQSESSGYPAPSPISCEVDKREPNYQNGRSFEDNVVDEDLGDTKRKERLGRILPLRLRFRRSRI